MEKFSTTDRGNGLRALAPLRPGELLFRSDPLAYTVSKGSRGVVCDRCLLGYVSPSPESKTVQGPGCRGRSGAALPGLSRAVAALDLRGVPRCPAPHFP